MPWVGRPVVPTGTVRPLLSCLVSLSLSLPICKVSFLPLLNFCGSVAALARAQGEGRRMRADTKAVIGIRVGQILGTVGGKEQEENHLLL